MSKKVIVLGETVGHALNWFEANGMKRSAWRDGDAAVVSTRTASTTIPVVLDLMQREEHLRYVRIGSVAIPPALQHVEWEQA